MAHPKPEFVCLLIVLSSRDQRECSKNTGKGSLGKAVEGEASEFSWGVEDLGWVFKRIHRTLWLIGKGECNIEVGVIVWKMEKNLLIICSQRQSLLQNSFSSPVLIHPWHLHLWALSAVLREPAVSSRTHLPLFLSALLLLPATSHRQWLSTTLKGTEPTSAVWTGHGLWSGKLFSLTF